MTSARLDPTRFEFVHAGTRWYLGEVVEDTADRIVLDDALEAHFKEIIGYDQGSQTMPLMTSMELRKVGGFTLSTVRVSYPRNVVRYRVADMSADEQTLIMKLYMQVMHPQVEQKLREARPAVGLTDKDGRVIA